MLLNLKTKVANKLSGELAFSKFTKKTILPIEKFTYLRKQFAPLKTVLTFANYIKTDEKTIFIMKTILDRKKFNLNSVPIFFFFVLLEEGGTHSINERNLPCISRRNNKQTGKVFLFSVNRACGDHI